MDFWLSCLRPKRESQSRPQLEPITSNQKPTQPPSNSPGGRSSSPAASYIHAVCYPNWRADEYQRPSALDFSKATHVYYSFASLDGHGTVYPSDERIDCELEMDGTNGAYHAFAQLRDKKYPQLKLMLSIGGLGATASRFADVTSDDVRIKRCAQTARALIDKFKFTGINIDWEFPASPQEGNQYLKLLIELRKQLPLPKYLLHVSILVSEWALCNVSLLDIAETVDLVGVMAYDFVDADYPNCAYSGHHAQLWSPKNPPSSAYRLSGDGAVTYILGKGVPAGKVALGIPLYGRSFLKARAIFKRHKGVGGNDGVFEARQLPRPGTKEKYDDVLCAAFCVGGDGGFVSYDNKISLRKKAEYVKEKGLAGMFYWHIGQDRAGDESLIQDGYNALFSDQQ